MIEKLAIERNEKNRDVERREKKKTMERDECRKRN